MRCINAGNYENGPRFPFIEVDQHMLTHVSLFHQQPLTSDAMIDRSSLVSQYTKTKIGLRFHVH